MALLSRGPECPRGHRCVARRARRLFGSLNAPVLLIGLLLSSSALAAQTTPSREDQLKAVFLFNFAQFVEWPPEAFAGAETPFVIGILGEDPFGDYLDELVQGEHVNRRALVVKRYGRMEEVGSCHVLYVSRSETGNWQTLFASLKGRHVLTVGDVEGFARGGGMIRFATDNRKLRLNINVGAAEASGLTISSKLLRSADIVTTGKD